MAIIALRYIGAKAHPLTSVKYFAAATLILAVIISSVTPA